MKPILIGAILLLFAGTTSANGNRGQSHSHGYYQGDRCDNTTAEYLEYEQAVALGKQTLAEKNVSLGDVARKLRAQKGKNLAAKSQDPAAKASDSAAETQSSSK
jgi:hypothetical protein